VHAGRRGPAPQGYQGRTIGIKLRFADFQTVTRDLTLPAAIDDAQAIRRAAGECLRRVPLDRKLRLLGVRVSALSARVRGRRSGATAPARAGVRRLGR
jgi:nucleotidyltransferase/DNA polymerase involved in DNA repair